MRTFLSFKAGFALALFATLVTAGYLYANHLVFDVNVIGNMQMTLSTQDPLVVLSGDGQTLIGSGDTLEFGTVEVDYWGTSPVPVKRVTIKNTSSTPELVIVTGDLTDGVLPLFGFTRAGLKPAPGNAFRLEPAGESGDTATGWIGLRFLAPPGQIRPTAGGKRTTIIIRASEIPVPVLASKLGIL